MKRNRLGRRGGLPRDAEQLLWLANGLADSSSRAEDHFWDQRLADAVGRLLRSEDEDALNTALDHLSTASAHAYDELGRHDRVAGRRRPQVRRSARRAADRRPVMAWSRYRIPATIAAAAMANLRVQLKAHVLAKDVKLALADFLFSPDQLPQGYCATADFATHLGKAAQSTDTDLHIKTDNLPETAQFLSDTRYLLGAVVVPKGAHLPLAGRRLHPRTGLEQWRAQGGACFARCSPAAPSRSCCPTPTLPPAAKPTKPRAPTPSRPGGFLSTTWTPRHRPARRGGALLRAPGRGIPHRLHAARPERSRAWRGVAAARRRGREQRDPRRNRSHQRACGITDILVLDNEFPMEYCDDCGAPMYPSPDGEAVPAELPKNRPSRCRNICTDPPPVMGRNCSPPGFCPPRPR